MRARELCVQELTQLLDFIDSYVFAHPRSLNHSSFVQWLGSGFLLFFYANLQYLSSPQLPSTLHLKQTSGGSFTI
jgi:hypothetical protein